MIVSESSRVILVEGRGISKLYMSANQVLLNSKFQIVDFLKFYGQKFCLVLLGDNELDSGLFQREGFYTQEFLAKDTIFLMEFFLRQGLGECGDRLSILESSSMIEVCAKLVEARARDPKTQVVDYQIFRDTDSKILVYVQTNADISETKVIEKLSPELKRFFF